MIPLWIVIDALLLLFAGGVVLLAVSIDRVGK